MYLANLKKYKLLVLESTLLGLFSTAGVADSQSNLPAYVPTIISVTQSRPLSAALGQLQKLYRTPINFEEVPYENPADLASRDVQTPSGPVLHTLYPRPGALTVRIGQDEAKSAYLGVEAALLSYINSGLGGVYQVVQGQLEISVFPSQVLASSGSMKTVVPVMTQKISFPSGQRSAAATFQLIASQLTAVTGIPIQPGATNFPDDGQITLGCSAEAANDVLKKLTSHFIQSSYWLLYDPYEKTYYLSLLSVPGFSPGVSGPQPPPGQTNSFFTEEK